MTNIKLESGEDSLVTRNGDIRARLLINVNNLVVINNDSISGSTGSKSKLGKIEGATNGGGKSSVTIRSKNHLVSGTKGFTPGRLNKWIISRNNNNVINTLGLEITGVGNERRNVVGSASRSESSWNSNNDHLLVGKFFGSIIRNRDSTCFKMLGIE